MYRWISFLIILFLGFSQNFVFGDILLNFSQLMAKGKINGYVWDRVRKVSRTDNVKIDFSKGKLGFKADCRSIDPSGAYACLVISGVDYSPRKLPVIEMKFRVTDASRPITFVWLNQQGKSKEYDYTSFYGFDRSCNNGWRTVRFRLDKNKHGKGIFSRINRFEINLDTRFPGRKVEMEIEYIKIRRAIPDEQYTTDKKPLPEPIKLNQPLRKYPRLKKIFTFGVWGITAMRFQEYPSPMDIRFDDGGMQTPMRNLRKNYCNAVLNPGTGTIDFEEQKIYQLIPREDRLSYIDCIDKLCKLAEQYEMYFAPLTYGAIPMGKTYHERKLKKYMLPLLERFGKCERILAWYAADEPPIKWRDNYAKGKEWIESRSPLQPALMLSCSEQHLAAYANLCQVIMTDCYPIEYPIYYKGKYLARDPWRIIDWCKTVKKYAPESPHYLVLSCHDFWNQAYPTVEEIRLQTWLGLAYGADGIYYFIYSHGPQWLYKYIDRTLVDPYGNPSELWNEVGRLGKKLLPIGKFLMMSKPIKSPVVKIFGAPIINTVNGPKVAVEGIVKTNPDKLVLVFLWNNDLYRSQLVDFQLEEVNNRLHICDLTTFEDLGRVNQKIKRVQLEAGGGRVYVVCSQKQFKEIHRSAMKTKAENEIVILKILVEEAKRDEIDINEIRKNLNIVKRKFCRASEVTEYEQVFEELSVLKSAVNKAYADSDEYPLIRKIERCRKTLGRIHRILCDKLEAPRIVMGKHLPNPFPVLKQPGRSYAETGLLLSLVFKKICEMRENGKIRETKNIVDLLVDEADRFLIQCRENLQMQRPVKAMMNEDLRKAMIEFLGCEYWQRKVTWLDKDNGIPAALKKLRKSQK